jgi:hypothetical protein
MEGFIMAELGNRDYTVIIDKSGSMGTRDQRNGRSRWATVQESTLAVARKCEEFDPDGITVYTFGSKFRRYDNVTSSKVEQIFSENEPMGSTALAEVLKDAFDNYFVRKAQGKTKANGELFVVITDGEPDDKAKVWQTLIEAANKVHSDTEIGVSLIQVGNNSEATSFLKACDDRLQEIGARFDIVDTITVDEMEDTPLTEVLLRALID